MEMSQLKTCSEGLDSIGDVALNELASHVSSIEKTQCALREHVQTILQVI